MTFIRLFQSFCSNLELKVEWTWGHDSTGSIKYYYSPEVMTYDMSIEFCQERGAHLAEVSNADDFQFYRDLLKSSDSNSTIYSFWLGAGH